MSFQLDRFYFEMTKGDEPVFEIRVVKNGQPFPLADCTVEFGFKDELKNTAVLFSATVTPSNEEGGVVDATIPSATTLNYTKQKMLYGNARVIDADGKPHTILEGRLLVKLTAAIA